MAGLKDLNLLSVTQWTGYSAEAAQFRKDLVDVLSTTMGMNLWFAPQISEHWP